MRAISRSLARATDLRPIGVEDITPHYVRTLRCWRENFLAHIDHVRALGYDRRFERIWELYLAYCEGGFGGGRIRDIQLLLAKPRYAIAPSRAVPRRDRRDSARGAGEPACGARKGIA